MPHVSSGFSPTTVENPVFGPPVPGRGIVLRPTIRVAYGSPVTGSGIVPPPPDRVNNDSELPLLALDAG
jgi:hypothetical protein